MSVIFAGRISLLLLTLLFTSTFAQQKYKAVNLGGWLVLEQFITPDLFSGLPEKQWTEADASNKDQNAVKNHHMTFVTEDDFIYLKNTGINAVRIPVGWWITQTGTLPPYDVAGSQQALDNAFEWGRKHGIQIIVDLHSARGSQNTQGHSGSNGVCKWRNYMAETVQHIGFLANKYANHPALLGIELLNEPYKDCVSTGDLKKYYEMGYNEVRRHSSKAYVILSPLFGDNDSGPSLVPLNSQNVVLDIHIYSWFLGDRCLSNKTQANTDCVYNQLGPYVKGLNSNANNAGARLLVGEWTDAYKAEDASISARKQFSQAQQTVYGDASFGWAYWTLKHSNGDQNLRYWS